MDVGENETADTVLARLDNELGVREWWTPMSARSARTAVSAEEELAPSWWHGAEAETQGWLASQGVTL